MVIWVSLLVEDGCAFWGRWPLEELDVSWHEKFPCHHCYHVMRKGGWGVVARPVLFAAGSYRGSVFCSRWHLVGPFSDMGQRLRQVLPEGLSLQFSRLQSISPPCYQLNFHLPSTNLFFFLLLIFLQESWNFVACHRGIFLHDDNALQIHSLQ